MKVIFSMDIKDKRNRLTKYSGIGLAQYEYEEGYLIDSYIPTGIPLELSDDEYNKILLEKYIGDIGNTIFLIKVANHNASYICSTGELPENKESLLKGIVQDILEKVKVGGEVHPIRICTTNDSQKTITRDYKSFHKVGLHIDSWDSVQLCNRLSSSNRLVMNLGPTSRNLLFIDRSVDSLVRENSIYKNEYEGKEFSTHYFNEHPKSIVYSLQINPGEAYIAPTENLIHDATVPGNNQINSTFMLRGKIEPKEMLNEILCNS